jgi:putative DNA primase/helicase
VQHVTLTPAHFKHLRSSVLNDEYIAMMACHSPTREVFEAIHPALIPCESVLAFPYPNCNGYERYRLFPPQGDMKYFQIPGSTSHLYILPAVRAILSNPSIDLVIVEGEKKAGCLTQHGVAAIAIGGVWSWLIKDTCELLPEFDQIAFVDRNVLIVFDSDCWVKQEIQRALYALGKAIENRGAKVEALIIPPADDGSKQGADDFIATHGIGKLKGLKRIKLRHDGLAQHKPWWESWVKGKTRDAKELSKVSSRLQPVEPWPDPVDGLSLAREIHAVFKRFVVTVEPQATVVESLWVLFAHAIDAFGISPMLAFWSPVPECGKTINQSVVGRLTPKSLEATNLTEAVVFRVIEKFAPTLLIDEAADLQKNRPELMDLLRASHQRNKAFVYRTVGDNHEVTAFCTWSPKSFAITKKPIESALASRSLIIRMHRKTRGEKAERYSSTKEYPELTELCRKASRWATDNLQAIRDAAPENLPDIENRSLDNYEPLFKIAHVIGGEWPSVIHKASLKLLGADNPTETPTQIELLKDVKAVFEAMPEPLPDKDRQISSADLVKELVAKEDRSWVEYSQGKPITQNQVARLLKSFPIYSRVIRVGEKTPRGYTEHQFDDAFERYLSQTPLVEEPEPQQRSSDNENNDLGQKTQPQQNDSVAVDEISLSVGKDKQCCAVAVGDIETGDPDTFCLVSLPAAFDRFTQINVSDLEFYCPIGHNPQPHSVGSLDIRSGSYCEYLNEKLPGKPPYGFGHDDLLLLYSGSSDLSALKAAGYPWPANFIDPCVEAKLQFNDTGSDRGLPGLVEACAKFGIKHGTDPKTKEKLSKFYGETETLSAEQKAEMMAYLRTDVEALANLFAKLVPSMDRDEALERGEYVKVNALIESNGLLVDAEPFNKIAANREQIQLDLIAESPIGSEIYTSKGKFNHKRFGAWLEKNEITGWNMARPTTYSRKEEDIEAYAGVHPLLKQYRDLYFALKDFKNFTLGIGSDGRVHNSNCPFGTITGRNKPNGGFIFSLSKWFRWLIRAPEGCAIIHFDFSVMEFAIAAYLSGDQNMIAAYESKDVHQTNADNLGVTRDEAKAFTFSTQYGGGPRRFAQEHNMDIDKAYALFQAHEDAYPRLYEWKAEVLNTFKREGVYKLPGDGWYLKASANLAKDPHEQRTATNFAVQGLGATIQRYAVRELTRYGMKIIATQHDSITVEVSKAKAAAQKKTGIEIMRDVSAKFLGGHSIRVDTTVYTGRFKDPKGAEDWKRISKLLKKYK